MLDTAVVVLFTRKTLHCRPRQARLIDCGRVAFHFPQRLVTADCSDLMSRSPSANRVKAVFRSPCLLQSRGSPAARAARATSDVMATLLIGRPLVFKGAGPSAGQAFTERNRLGCTGSDNTAPVFSCCTGMAPLSRSSRRIAATSPTRWAVYSNRSKASRCRVQWGAWPHRRRFLD
jgi:hypothetical protein